jgi:hypothetical protein
MERIGQVFGKSGTWASQYLQLLKLPKELQARMDPSITNNRRLPVTLGSRLGRIPQAKALEIMAEADANGWNAKRTGLAIDRYVSSEGVAEHRKGRKPSDGLRNFERALRLGRATIERELEKAREDGGKEFRKIFASKDKDQVRAMLSDITEIAGLWGDLAREVKAHGPLGA